MPCQWAKSDVGPAHDVGQIDRFGSPSGRHPTGLPFISAGVRALLSSPSATLCNGPRAGQARPTERALVAISLGRTRATTSTTSRIRSTALSTACQCVPVAPDDPD
jgi:hypothetical protein